jgi:hypothetical protein
MASMYRSVRRQDERLRSPRDQQKADGCQHKPSAAISTKDLEKARCAAVWDLSAPTAAALRMYATSSPRMNATPINEVRPNASV